jgi:hypothetical protein
MANHQWDTASVDEKLDMLPEDIRLISETHNTLGREFRSHLGRFNEFEKEIRRSLPKK